jgi:hypothetical protein
MREHCTRRKYVEVANESMVSVYDTLVGGTALVIMFCTYVFILVWVEEHCLMMMTTTRWGIGFEIYTAFL